MIRKHVSKFMLTGFVLSSTVFLLTLGVAQAGEGGGVAAGEAAAVGPQPPSPGLAAFEAKKGRVAVAGVGLRGQGGGILTISGIPDGARIRRAYLYWSVVDNTTPTSNAGTFDGTPISGDLIGSGPSPCWSPPSTHAFRADVKDIVKARPDPNGAYALSGFPDSGDYNTAPSMHGATLVIIWKKKGAGKRLILVQDGLDVTTVAGQTVTTTITFEKKGRLFEAKDPADADLTVIGGDGQVSASFSDFTNFNGVDVGTNSWDASDGDMQDTDTFNVSALVTPGDTQATASIGIPAAGGDCIAWTVAILEVKAKKVPLE